jgi:hypothetical protein
MKKMLRSHCDGSYLNPWQINGTTMLGIRIKQPLGPNRSLVNGLITIHLGKNSTLFYVMGCPTSQLIILAIDAPSL